MVGSLESQKRIKKKIISNYTFGKKILTFQCISFCYIHTYIHEYVASHTINKVYSFILKFANVENLEKS